MKSNYCTSMSINPNADKFLLLHIEVINGKIDSVDPKSRLR